MIEPIPGFLSPFFKNPDGISKETDNKSLKNQAESFYAWYLSVRKHSYPSDGYQGLQYIMRMGQLSTPTNSESQEAISELNALAEDLDEGRKSLGQIPYEIGRIVDRLIEKNSKNKFVKQVTHIEMIITSETEGSSEDLHKLIDTLVQKTIAEMSPIKTEQFCRSLEQVSSKNIKELKDHIHMLIEQDRPDQAP